MLDLLALGERPVGDLVQVLGLSQPSVSKHLRVLRQVGLVRGRREGRRILYRTNAAAIRPLYQWAGTFERFWSQQLSRIKERAESTHRESGRYPMDTAASTANDFTLSISQEMRVNASLEATFAAILDEMGPRFAGEDGKPLGMKIEARPGGRWYRDLGGDNGHLWGHVQAIKRPTLLEFTGPLFMSYAAVSNIQYRLSPVDGGTLIAFKHSAMGLIPDEDRAGMNEGWTDLLEGVRRNAEGGART